MQPATSLDGPAARAELDEQLARRRLAMRLLAALLAGLWTGLAVVVLVAYRPGGPVDVVAGLTVALPAVVTAAAIPWPPVSRVWKRQAAIAWLGLVAAMLVGPLVGIVVTQLVSGGGRTLLPSPEVAYAAVLAAGASALFASLGVVAARDGRLDPDGPEAVLERRPSLFAATALALVITTVIGVLFGGSVQLNELALREEPLPPSRFGPTDPALANPRCDTPISIGPGASLEIAAQAFVDDEPVGSAFLTGQRSGTDEQWTGSADGPSGPVVTGYIRTGDEAWRQEDGRWIPSAPDPYGLLGVNQLTVDGPVVVAIVRPENPPVAEDVGLELIEGAKARHCRTAIDGPTALDMLVPLRWIAGGDPVAVTATLPAWRGTLDWWVFADGQLGMAQVVINGYPGDAWKTSGLQGEIHAELRAIDRAFAHTVQAPPETLVLGPTGSPSVSPSAVPVPSEAVPVPSEAVPVPSEAVPSPAPASPAPASPSAAP